MDAYAELWKLTKKARPTRLTDESRPNPIRGRGTESNVGPAGPLTREERENLYEELTDWYYEQGNGMYLGDKTRNISLKAKANLVRRDDRLEPPELRELVEELPGSPDERRGRLSIRQLSLLRARMRADLEVYGGLYFGQLSEADVKFLEACQEDLDKAPCKGAARGERDDEVGDTE